jgi:putative nucleotidyltransferase with HDIG domain
MPKNAGRKALAILPAGPRGTPRALRLLLALLSDGRQIGTVVGLGAIYFVAAKLGLKLAYYYPSATPVWPPTGIALAVLLLIGYRAWPGIFLGAFLANLTTAGTVWTSLGIAAGNTLEGVVGAFLVSRYANGSDAFDRPLDVFKLAGLAAVLSPIVSATIGVTSLSLGGFAPWADYQPIWLTWWLGDAAGALIVAPLIILWCKRPYLRWDGRASVERALFLAALLAVSWVVFGGMFPFVYLTVPFLVWAAFRFEQRETATVIALLAGLAVWGTVTGHGPFVGATPNASLLYMQAFMGIMVLVALPLASVVAEREAATKKVRDLHRQVQEHNAVLEKRVRQRTQELDEAHLEMLERLAMAAEFRDDNTGRHTKRVAHMAALLARNLGLPNEQVELLRQAAPLHDVGKISVPDRILLKPGPLTPEESEVMKTHPTIGAQILSGGRFPLLRLAEEIALTHHERWDGTGYPRGLRGEAIPLSGRIVALADAFDALTSPRSYKKAGSLEAAAVAIKRAAGSQFDPRVVDAFLLHTPEPLVARVNKLTSSKASG